MNDKELRLARKRRAGERLRNFSIDPAKHDLLLNQPDVCTMIDIVHKKVWKHVPNAKKID